MERTFIVTSVAGPNRDLAKGAREQERWDEHAAFIDRLVDDGFILLGGPLPDEGGAVLVVRADSDAAARERLANDPWYVHGVLVLERIRRWDIFIDRWAAVAR